MASSNSKDNDDVFRRDYAKSIADALLERKDDETRQDKNALIHDAYVALCHDDPRVESDKACQLLAKALVDKASPYCLSERLVDGVRQATDRITRSTTKGTTIPESNTEKATTVEWNTGGVATGAGYATVAVACFVTVPLRCLHSTDKSDVQEYLGSYRAFSQPQPHELPLESSHQDARVEALAQRLDEVTALEEGSSVDNSKHQEDYEEVWAAESDPSDFEYESGYNPQQALDELDQWCAEAQFDPIALSKPLKNDDNIPSAIASLLSELTYSKLAALSQQQWNALQLTDLLSQLTLTLLLDHQDSTLLMNDTLQQLGVKPLFCLRDCATGRPDHVLPDYLTLVQTLVAADAAATAPTTGTIAPATIIGLGALSSLCASASSSQPIRQCVLETCEDLAHVMERASSDEQTCMHVMWSLLPMLDRLTGICSDGTTLDASPLHITNADAQLLLQTGMFRQVVVLATKIEKKMHLLRSIQVMCVQSTTLLGKYAWRVPELSQIVQVDDFVKDHAVDGLVWNLLGTTLAGASGQLVRRNVPTVTVDKCRDRCACAFEIICAQVITACDAIGKLRLQQAEQHDGSRQENGNIVEEWKQHIQDFCRFANYLVSCPSLANLWSAVSDATFQSELESVRTALSNLPRAKQTSSKKSADDDGDDKAGSSHGPSGEEEEASLRKAIKILSLSWQSSRAERLSSKTD